MTAHLELRPLLALTAAGLTLACREPAPQREVPPPQHPTHELTPRVRPIARGELCVTSGELRWMPNARWLSTRAALRATAAHSAGHHAALEFRYLGGTEHVRPLGSGAARRQLGLKLLSRDSCNVIYAMWRFDTPAAVVASVKANPSAAHHSECGNRGYRTLRPLWRATVDPPQVGSVHELSATLERGLLEVRIDQRPVLRASVGGLRTPTSGASGLRSDNVRFELMRFQADLPEGKGETSGGCGLGTPP